MEPMILMYNLASPRGMRLKLICAQLKMAARDVRPEEYGLPLGALAGIPIPAEHASEDGTFSDEMLLLAGLDEAQLNGLLQAMREEGIRIPLKAVLTPFNAAWSSLKLHAAIREEHESMRQTGQAGR